MGPGPSVLAYCENLDCVNDQCRDFSEAEMVVLSDDEPVEMEGDVCPECVDADREIRFTI